MTMPAPAAQLVVNELSQRAAAWRPAARLRGPPGLPKRLQAPNAASVHVLSERSTPDSCAVALTVEDVDGDRWLVIRQFIREAGEWRGGFGTERVDQPVPGKSGPYAALSARLHDGRFFGGGHVQSAGYRIARVRLVWTMAISSKMTSRTGLSCFLACGTGWIAQWSSFSIRRSAWLPIKRFDRDKGKPSGGGWRESSARVEKIRSCRVAAVSPNGRCCGRLRMMSGSGCRSGSC